MKILMISDYNAPVGGIEQYIRDAAQLLRTEDNEVQIVWLSLRSGLLHRVRPLLLPMTGLNMVIACKVVRSLITNKPDLIWRNSVSRYIWWFPIWVAGWRRIRTWMMYHDLWYFHPYPSLLTDVSQIPSNRTLRSWLAAGRAVGKTGVLQQIMMTLKFWSLGMIRRALIRSTSIHLVPSPYMVDIVAQRWIEPTKIHVLGHFGRIEL